MRDDIQNLPLPRSAKRYARMTGPKWLGPGKAKLYIQMVADTTNGGDTSLSIKDAGETVGESLSKVEELPDKTENCAWCLAEKGLASPEGMSHGICRRHSADLLRQLDDLSAKKAIEAATT